MVINNATFVSNEKLYTIKFITYKEVCQISLKF
jgi:hypothetical protein